MPIKINKNLPANTQFKKYKNCNKCDDDGELLNGTSCNPCSGHGYLITSINQKISANKKAKLIYENSLKENKNIKSFGIPKNKISKLSNKKI